MNIYYHKKEERTVIFRRQIMFCYNFFVILRSDKEKYKKVLTKRMFYGRIEKRTAREALNKSGAHIAQSDFSSDCTN